MPLKEGTGFILTHKNGGVIGTKSKFAVNQTGWLFSEWAHAKNEVNKLEKEYPSLKGTDWWKINYVNNQTLKPITLETVHENN